MVTGAARRARGLAYAVTRMATRTRDSMLADYRLLREEQDDRCEAVTLGYPREVASYYGTDGEGRAVEQRWTWKRYLQTHPAEVWPDPAENLAGDLADVADAPILESVASDVERPTFLQAGPAEIAADVAVRVTGATLAALAVAGDDAAFAELVRRVARGSKPAVRAMRRVGLA